MTESINKLGENFLHSYRHINSDEEAEELNLDLYGNKVVVIDEGKVVTFREENKQARGRLIALARFGSTKEYRDQLDGLIRNVTEEFIKDRTGQMENDQWSRASAGISTALKVFEPGQAEFDSSFALRELVAAVSLEQGVLHNGLLQNLLLFLENMIILKKSVDDWGANEPEADPVKACVQRAQDRVVTLIKDFIQIAKEFLQFEKVDESVEGYIGGNFLDENAKARAKSLILGVGE